MISTKYFKSKINILTRINVINGQSYRNSSNMNSLIKNNFLEISDEIKNTNKPVVALESTIITHGLPYPANLETALAVENEIRSLGVVPATIGFLNGRIKVGLNINEIETIATKNQNAIKLSRRDLPYVLAAPDRDSIIGGTTVSATCIAAHAANIPIFCTGGIGGVHRDYIDSMDVSADLQELARTPVAVVSSGVKSILDIGKTLEYLETMGVCVTTLNETGSKDFPAFFTSSSGHESPYNCRNEKEAASLINANLKTGFNTGLLIGVPIPENYSAKRELIDAAITEALAEAHKLKIKGKKVTPFLLEKINNITKGRSLSSNVALIKHNARVSAKIAIELKNLQNPPRNTTNSNDRVTIIGGINLDLCYKLKDEETLHLKGVTQPAELHQTPGGVARNMAEALINLGCKDTALISAIGNDYAGNFLTNQSRLLGLDTSLFRILDQNTVSTGSYCAILDKNGQLNMALGDMRAHDYINVEYLQKNIESLKNSKLCVIDANIPIESMKFIGDYCESNGIPIWFNPTDIRKCDRVIEAGVFDKITYMSPNYKELFKLFKIMLQQEKLLPIEEHADLNKVKFKNETNFNSNLEMIEMEDLRKILRYLLKYVPFIFLSRGTDDLIVASRNRLAIDEINQLPTALNYKNFRNVSDFEPYMTTYPIVRLEEGEQIENVNGAGDSASAGIITGIVRNYTVNDAIYYGLLSAKYTIMSKKTVSDGLSRINPEQIRPIVEKYRASVKQIKLTV